MRFFTNKVLSTINEQWNNYISYGTTLHVELYYIFQPDNKSSNNSLLSG